MGICPRCRYEYQDTVLVCPDCEETLVDRLPPQSTAAVTPDDSWVIVGGVESPSSSDMAKGSLNSNNIPSVVLSSGFTAFGRGAGPQSGWGSSFKGSNLIMVPKEYEEEAAVILESVLGDELIQPNAE